jgi:AAA+ ATPase superfamily predicted ATPase
MPIQIERHEASDISKAKSWILVYGRRKTGKTYLLKNFTKWDCYFLVRKDGNVTYEENGHHGVVSALELSRKVGDQLSSNKTVIVDEFQRLPQAFLEDIAAFHPNGKLVLTGSSFRVMNEVFGKRSPVLGLLAEHKIGLASPSDVLSSLSKHMGAPAAIEFGAFARDPWLIPHLHFKDSLRELFDISVHFQNAITSLMGEVFQEEERSLTQLYESLLRLIGAGYQKSEDLVSIMSSRGLLKNGASSAIVPNLNNMERMDLVEELAVYPSKRKKAYLLKSPIFQMFYYLADRYEIEQRDVGYAQAQEAVRVVRNLAIQRFIGEIFARSLHGKLEYSYDPELDFIITKKGRPVLVGEVKWGKYDKSDLQNFKKKASDLDCRKVLVAPKKNGTLEGMQIMDATDIVGLAQS